jgi:hypothetical protein
MFKGGNPLKSKQKVKKITLPKATQREMLKFFAQAFETIVAKEMQNDQPPNGKGNKK